MRFTIVNRIHYIMTKRNLQAQRSKNCLFGKLLRKIRKQRHISARQLAKKVGIDPSYVSKIETLKVPAPAWEVILAMSRELHSDALLEAGEYSFLRHMLFLSSSLLHRLTEIPPSLVTELGPSSIASWKQNCSELLGAVDTAYFRRVKWEEETQSAQSRNSEESA
jgi:transcriptional regulator with XRE-family HTH domain